MVLRGALAPRTTMLSSSGSVLSAPSRYPANAVSLCVVPILRTVGEARTAAIESESHDSY